MAAHLKTVTNRLCCSYLKSPVNLYMDTTSSKGMHFQYRTNKLKNHTRTQLCNRDVNPNSSNCTQNANSTYTIPASQNPGTWYRYNSSLNMVPLPVVHQPYCNYSEQTDKSDKPDANAEKPYKVDNPHSEEHMESLVKVLTEDLRYIFATRMDYTIYDSNIIFENNIRGNRTVGLRNYISQIALLRTIGHIRFAHVRLEILKITKHPEEGTIKCRWRIVGIRGSTVILQFWKFLPGKSLSETVKEAPTWVDGFSIYYVGSEGKIVKHVIHKMQPDDDKVMSGKPTIATKLAMFLKLPDQEKAFLMCAANESNLGTKFLSKVMLPLERL